MAGFNGSGTYIREYDWTDDAANGVDIEATRMDTEMDAMATALSTCITKDGQTTVTANLPMANFRHTGVGDSSARTHYGKVSQIQDGSYLWFGTTGGAANAYTATVSPAITAYAAGQRFRGIIHAANSGASTINFNGLGAKSITKWGTAALDSGDMLINTVVDLVYDGTRFQLINVSRQIASDAQMEAGADNVVQVTPLRLLRSPYAVKAWGWVAYSGGVPALVQSWNISSITDLSVGVCRMNLGITLSNAGWVPLVTTEHGSILLHRVAVKTTTAVEVIHETVGGVATDPLGFSFALLGDI